MDSVGETRYRCTCGAWSFDGPPEFDVECAMHGDPDVVMQIYGLDALIFRLKLQLNSMYGKGTVTYPSYTPKAPALRVNPGASGEVQREEWVRKYVGDNGGVVISTWTERHDITPQIAATYGLYLNGSQEAVAGGVGLSSLISLRDFLTRVIDSETKTAEASE